MWCFKGKKKKKPKKKGKLNQIEISHDLNKKRNVLKRIQKHFSNKRKSKAKGQSSPPEIVTEISQQASQQASQHAESNLADNISEAPETEVTLKEPLQEQIVTEISQQASQQASQHAESNLADTISEAPETTEVILNEPLQEQEMPQDFMNKDKPFCINIEAEIHEDSENSEETPKGAQVVEPLRRKRARQLFQHFMTVLSLIIPILAFVDTILIFLDSGPKTGTNKYNIIHGVFLVIYLVDFILNLINKNQWKKDEMVVILLNTLDVVLDMFMDQDFQQKFRAVRILRMVFILRLFPRMRFDIKVALQPESSVLHAFFLILYLFFIIVPLFYHYFHEIDHARFGSRRRTIFTLSQVLVLDDWYDIFLDNNAKGAGHILLLLTPFVIIIHFIGFSLITAMIMHNYFVAYDAMKKAKAEAKAEKDDEETFSTESTDLESEEIQNPYEQSILEKKREIELQMEFESVYDQIVENNEAFQIYSVVLQEILHFITCQPMTMKPDT